MAGRGLVGMAAALSLFATAALAQMPGNTDAQSNVRQSRQYDELVCNNPGFRAKRIAQECGPLDDPQLKASCLASFDCGKPQQPVDFRQAPPSETIK